MTTPLNLHGDQLTKTTGQHGADIASQRIDDLDKRALQHLLDLSASHPVCVDFGCGLGWQGLRFAMLGADAYLYDFLPESEIIKQLRQVSAIRLKYTCSDIRSLQAESLPSDIAIAFSQRFVHYLTYEEAQAFVQATKVKMLPGALFFLSASGIDSELGSEYPLGPVERRFAHLHPSMQTKHGIYENVCLYNEADLNQLMQSCGYESVSIWRSEFGNIKGVFRR